MTQDFRFALRQLRRTPGCAAVTVLTFALGIGANTAVFSVMNAVVLRMLPVAEPERLVYLHTTGRPPKSSQTGFDDSSLSMPVYEQLRFCGALIAIVIVTLGASLLPARRASSVDPLVALRYE